MFLMYEMNPIVKITFRVYDSEDKRKMLYNLEKTFQEMDDKDINSIYDRILKFTDLYKWIFDEDLSFKIYYRCDDGVQPELNVFIEKE